MPVQAYYDWIAAGRPWRDARSIAETKDQLRTAYPLTVVGRSVYPNQTNGGIQTDDSHLFANPPQDHTPYPAYPWPIQLPAKPSGYIVCAIDYIHNRGDLNCNELFPILLNLAKTGQRPFCKYLIWQARRYDVRNHWEPVTASGHWDHIHESHRSDWIDSGIQSYPNPFLALENTMADVTTNVTVYGGTSMGPPVPHRIVDDPTLTADSTGRYGNSLTDLLQHIRGKVDAPFPDELIDALANKIIARLPFTDEDRSAITELTNAVTELNSRLATP